LEARSGRDAPVISRANERILYTIGHGVLPIEELLRLIRSFGVDLVVDVRSQPFSRRASHFNREALGCVLGEHGVAYRWVPELGGRPEADLRTDAGAPDYERMAATTETAHALDKLADVAARRTVAILCSESQPTECHRSRMLEPELARRGIWVEHILHSGKLAARPTLFT
jgi:uncharacterized protein (DUF488 family)